MSRKRCRTCLDINTNTDACDVKDVLRKILADFSYVLFMYTPEDQEQSFKSLP